MTAPAASARVAAVVIGRNEGARLRRSLASLTGAAPVVYVDSGSTDGSVAHAASTGAEVVALDMAQPFTAARARNAGLDRLRAIAPETDYVQLLDGDTELRPGWLDAARAAIAADPRRAIVAGRLRERAPEASRWNRLIDAEWDTPPGEARECGGNALARMAALDAVGGFRGDLLAGEEPELCHRLIRAGWTIWRLDAEMALHDAAMTRFAQWWRRARRAGMSYAALSRLHGGEGLRRIETRRALVWGAALPLATLAVTALSGPAGLALLVLYPLQVIRLVLRGMGWEMAAFLTLAKFPEAQGVLAERLGHAFGRGTPLLDYRKSG